jgi:hypothetical protein
MLVKLHKGSSTLQNDSQILVHVTVNINRFFMHKLFTILLGINPGFRRNYPFWRNWEINQGSGCRFRPSAGTGQNPPGGQSSPSPLPKLISGLFIIMGYIKIAMKAMKNHFSEIHPYIFFSFKCRTLFYCKGNFLLIKVGK